MIAIVLETKVGNKLHLSWFPLIPLKENHHSQSLSHLLFRSKLLNHHWFESDVGRQRKMEKKIGCFMKHCSKLSKLMNYHHLKRKNVSTKLLAGNLHWYFNTSRAFELWCWRGLCVCVRDLRIGENSWESLG